MIRIKKDNSLRFIVVHTPVGAIEFISKSKEQLMKTITRSVMAIAIGFSIGTSYAADAGSISIITPSDGAVVQGNTISKLIYRVKLGPQGNHLHVYVDDQKPIVDREVTGCPCAVDLPPLSPGKHIIIVKEARADHSLTGLQSSTVFITR